MSKITILGKYLELDLLEYQDAKRVEDAMSAFYQRVGKLEQEQASLSGQVLGYCTATMEVFNDIFGPGTDKKLFGDHTNLGLCAQAFGQLAEEITKKQPKKAQELFSKYLPARQKDEPWCWARPSPAPSLWPGRTASLTPTGGLGCRWNPCCWMNRWRKSKRACWCSISTSPIFPSGRGFTCPT